MHRSSLWYLIALLPSNIAFANAGDNCIETTKVEHGKRCSTSNSVAYILTNRCTAPLDVKHCAERPDATWTCKVDRGLAQGKPFGNYICHGTGKLRIFTRPGGTWHKFPEP